MKSVQNKGNYPKRTEGIIYSDWPVTWGLKEQLKKGKVAEKEGCV